MEIGRTRRIDAIVEPRPVVVDSGPDRYRRRRFD